MVVIHSSYRLVLVNLLRPPRERNRRPRASGNRCEIQIEEPVRSRALGCIDRMLDFVARHPAAIAKPAQGFVPNIGAA